MFVKYNKPNMLRIGATVDRLRFTLMPGQNEIAAEKWDWGVKRYRILRTLLENGMIEVEEDEAGEPVVTSSDTVAESVDVSDTKAVEQATAEVNDLEGLNEKKAVKLVRDTLNDKLLTKWHGLEKRRAVVNAIEAQLEKLAKADAEMTSKPGVK